jgi:hypothetical protein
VFTAEILQINNHDEPPHSRNARSARVETAKTNCRNTHPGLAKVGLILVTHRDLPDVEGIEMCERTRTVAVRWYGVGVDVVAVAFVLHLGESRGNIYGHDDPLRLLSVERNRTEGRSSQIREFRLGRQGRART